MSSSVFRCTMRLMLNNIHGISVKIFWLVGENAVT